MNTDLVKEIGVHRQGGGPRAEQFLCSLSFFAQPSLALALSHQLHGHAEKCLFCQSNPNLSAPILVLPCYEIEQKEVSELSILLSHFLADKILMASASCC